MVSTPAFPIFLTLCVCSLAVATDWTSFRKNHVDLTLDVPRIIGGDVAVPHSYPFQVGLRINGNAFCGGSLITPNYVLTAAHCGEVIQRVEVILGAQNITDNESFQLIILGESVTNHEGFNYQDYQHDIALIKLSEPAPLNDFIGTVPLPSRSEADKEYIDETVTSIGWGLSADVTDRNPTIDDLSPLLRYVNVAVLSISECGEYYNYNVNNITYVTEKNICTSGYKNKGTCNGDSGGPLIHDGVLIGLVSIGTDLCEVCSPSIFTKVGTFLDWIEQHSDVVIS